MADVPILVFKSGTRTGQHVRVPEDDTLDLGRADQNHVVLKDDGISRFHARLLYDNGSLWLQDMGSRNGVFVNDARVSGHRALNVGDSVTIGSHVLEVCWEADASDLAPTVPDVGDSDALDTTTEESEAPQDRRRWFWPFD